MIDLPPGLDLKKQLDDLDRLDYEDSLYNFIKAAWKYMDPSPWKDGWHIGAIAEHLQAVTDGQIRNLISTSLRDMERNVHTAPLF
jgi:hypothetical protein